jgi:hypothetical protein
MFTDKDSKATWMLKDHIIILSNEHAPLIAKLFM